MTEYFSERRSWKYGEFLTKILGKSWTPQEGVTPKRDAQLGSDRKASPSH